MNIIRIPMALALALFAMACVTINVYFPAEAAEKAADRIIKDVYGEKVEQQEEPQSLNRFESISPTPSNRLLDWLITPAQAEADLSVNTPAIRQIKADMRNRHQQLQAYYTSGAVGITNQGTLKIRDQKLVPLQNRNNLKSIVAKENIDRDALYAEIARANAHPEWEREISATFARRWVDNARSGWWYMDLSGNWKQK